jgi:5'-3' exonuclease
MGVKGLWRLLLPVGRRISIETLEGQILAIDASIWLTQFLTVAARQREQDLVGDGVNASANSNSNSNSNGKAYSNDYLVGFLRRLCKLRYQGVRPVLVFDGETPEIKKREIRARNRRRKRKLGESFYLGGGNGDNNGDNNNTTTTQEYEEMLEATRRMAKRILAKQLRTGKLVTIKNKHKKQKTTNESTENSKSKSNVAIASAAYAPGFYDPDAAVVAPQAQTTTQTQAQQGNGATTDLVSKDSHVTDKNDCDDDHLLRDDYHTNPLQEEVNDWDKPIVVDSDDENSSNSSNNNNSSNSPKKKKKESSRNFGSTANASNHSTFHAGDGTKFRVKSVADLPESARKDVIEDARKQRRLASRREFMRVASDPDGLSSCQLRNFLKSTKLNRDIVKMAQTAKAKAEEEAKIIRGNGILFEKDENTGAFAGGGGRNSNSRIYKNRNGTNVATSRRQHYRSGAARNGGKKSNSGMMRMFHHKGQPQKGNDVGNDDIDDDDDEHDFRKARNNHYLSGGIRFVNSDDEDEEKDDSNTEEYFDEEKNTSGLRHHKTAPATATSEDDGGGFIVAVMDGSDKPRNKTMGKTLMNNGGDGEIIEIDISSSSESDENGSDDTDSEDDRKPRATKPKSKSTKSSQELRDEALARALQSIEEEETSIEDEETSIEEAGPGSKAVIGGDGARECIEIDDSDDGSGPGGGFSKNSTPSKERRTGDPQMQQEREDARLARTLQEAEYGEEEDQSDGGGFFVETNENSIDNENNMGDDGGFLVTTKEDNRDKEENPGDGEGFLVSRKEDAIDKEENPDVGGGFLVPTNEDIMNDKEENSGDGGCFLVPTKNDKINTMQSQSQISSSHGDSGRESDAKMARKEASFPREEWNPFSSNHQGANTSNSLFAMSKQRRVKKSESDLLVCQESSEDEEEEYIDWEDGNGNIDSSIHREEDSKKKNNAADVIARKEYKSPKRDKLAELLQKYVKNAVHSDNSDDTVDDDNMGEVNREDGDRKHRQPNKACYLEALALPKKAEKTTVHTQGTDEKNSDEDDDDDVDWEDGVEEANESKPAVIDVCAIKKGTRQTNRTGLYEIRETSDNDDEEVDWEEGDTETNEGTQEVIDLSSGKVASKQLAETTLNSADAYTKEIDGKDDEDDDEVDWEDGDDESNQSAPEVIDLCEEKESDDSLKKAPLNKADWEGGYDETNKNKTEVIDLCEEKKAAKLSIKPALIFFDNGKINREGDGKSKVPTTPTEEIDGAHGKTHHNSTDQEMEKAVDRKYSKESSKYFDTATESLTKTKAIDLDDDSNSDDDDQIEWEGGESEGSRTIVDGDDWGTTKTQSSDEVAAALEHAQGTAANLTDWAGRAFRRAIAQHAMENGMEIPESAKPGVLKNTRSDDVDRDEPVRDQVKTVGRAAQRTSQRSIQSRKQEDSLDRGASGDKIDNSDWLYTVDTANNTYAEDYTVAPQGANNPSDRLLDAATGGITEEMRTEVMQLLRLFGIPYVVAPSEAEAQCVELERLGLVDGIVTEDSDTFVFGGQVIYKNIFDDKKYVEVYHAKDASEEMNLTQDSLVALAMLLGGDYTEGVRGVGIVNGMEVLQAFDVAQDCEAGLKRFRKWLDGFDPNDLTKKNLNNNETFEDATGGIIRSEKEQLFHRKHHTARTRWIAPKHFPDAKVLNAYLNPVVDISTERFSWGIPDLDGLIAFCHGRMGLVAEETEKLIAPIIQRMEEGSMRQTRIDSFMRYEDGIKFAKIQSKRLRQVLGLSSKDSTATTEQQPRRKRVHATTVPTTSWNEGEENGNDGFCEYPEGSFIGESEEIFASIDAASSNTNVTMTIHDTAVREKVHQPPQPQPPKKRYNGKKSLAALSSAAASTVAIASSSKNDDVPGSGSSSIGGALGSVSRFRRSNNRNHTNHLLPKKAPPAYQKQSSAMLEEEGHKDNAAEPLDGTNTKTNIYEVINPSMI